MRKLHILCAGNPTPTAKRFGTSFVLELDDVPPLMFDCGPAATYKLAKAGFSPTQIEHLFFTHHHFDHNADYPCFLLARWDQSLHTTPALHIRGPQPTAQITERLIGEEGAFRDDLTARMNAAGSHAVYVNRGGVLPRPDPTVDALDIEPGYSHDCGSWQVSSALGSHMEPWLRLLVYRVDYADFSIVFATDTKPCAPPIELATGADVLVITCWDHQEIVDRDSVTKAMSGTRDVAEIAAQAGVGRLVLTHFCSGFTEPESLDRARREIGSIYDGEVVFGNELMVLDL